MTDDGKGEKRWWTVWIRLHATNIWFIRNRRVPQLKLQCGPHSLIHFSFHWETCRRWGRLNGSFPGITLPFNDFKYLVKSHIVLFQFQGTYSSGGSYNKILLLKYLHSQFIGNCTVQYYLVKCHLLNIGTQFRNSLGLHCFSGDDDHHWTHKSMLFCSMLVEHSHGFPWRSIGRFISTRMNNLLLNTHYD